MAVQKAWIETETGDRIDCLFNPTEYSVQRSNSWNPTPSAGRTSPELLFVGGNPGRLSIDLLFDTTSSGEPVTSHTDKLEKLLDVDTSLPGYDSARNTGRPPWVKFHWGSRTSFKAVVQSLQITFTYFSAEGTALRARAAVTLRQFEEHGNYPRQNPSSGTPLPERTHRVQRGETLDRIAARYYDDPSKWRLIAAANGVEDPLAVQPGTTLAIPKPEARRDL